jgi:hypothetical protein
MLHDRWQVYLTHRIACVQERIRETERLMRPPTPEELVALQQELELLKCQEAKLTCILEVSQPPGLFDSPCQG